MFKELEEGIKKALGELNLPEVAFSLEHPKELSHGDYMTNVALIVAKQEGKSPAEVAGNIFEVLKGQNIDGVERVEVAGPGFINFTLKREVFVRNLVDAQKKDWGQNNSKKGEKIMVEYTDPNPFKPFHIGHLMTNAIGESLARITESSGATVIRANYQGDVGLHVAKAIWGIQQEPLPEGLEDEKNSTVLAQYIGLCYVNGAKKYDENEEVKKVIDSINKKIYERSDNEVNKLYDWGRKITLEAFEEIYKTLGTKFNHYFFESEMASKGILLVREYLEKGIFEESEGAIVFKAERYNLKLHTRVFITSQGLPTYETKEIGLTKTKFEKENPDLSIVITAVEQKDYMAVATEAMRQIEPSLAERMKHITHGMMRFASGKMSSRLGNVVTGESLLNETKILVKQRLRIMNLTQSDTEHLSGIISVGAIKFAILRQAIGGDIIYNEEQALSFEGDSGPYLQYTAVRAGSLLQKGKDLGIGPNIENPVTGTETLERLIARFPEVIARAQTEWAPHYIVTYLSELAQEFNSWYGQGKIIDEDVSATAYRLSVVAAVRKTLINGLWVLGIEVPEKM